MTVTINGSTGVAVPLGSASAPAETNTTSSTTGIYYPTSTTLGLSTNGTNAVYIDSSQNVGIGTTSPASGVKFAVVGGGTQLSGGTSSQAGIRVQYASSVATITGINNDNNTYNPIAFYASGTEAMRIDGSGNLLVGTTTTSGANTTGVAMLSPASSATISVGHITGTGGGTSYLYMNYNGTNIGSITQSGTTAVAYNTSSDYRLKENVTPMTVGLATISALKPVTYDWVGTNENGEGFVAHELQEVIPHAVTGEKDAIDEDGNPIYQQMDNSGVIPFLVKAIQELKAEFDAYKATHP